eukprot:scaffold20.g7609.t1
MDLQHRLDAVFGSLAPPGEAPAWQPARQQVFRGSTEAGGDSSDEEWRERERREALPGLAHALAAEDEAGEQEEGYRPSAAFCRALDREAEYDDADELAAGVWARQRGEAAGEARPAPSTEVLQDNPYEQALQAAEAAGRPPPALQAAGPGGGGGRLGEGGGEAGAGSGPAAMETDAGAAGAEAQPLSPRSALADPSRPRLGFKKRVSFKGMPEAWVPPHRRPGFVPRGDDEGDGSADGGSGQAGSSGAGGSRVPLHVQHPDKFTCYALDAPLVVGGGAAQLGEGDAAGDLERAARAASAAAQQAAGLQDAGSADAEGERWQGPVGGGIQLRARPRAEGASAGEGGGKAAGTGAAGHVAGVAVGAQLGADEEGEEGRQDSQAGAAATALQAAPPGQRKQRSLRKAPMEED